jgi:DNA-binding NarL/FixJ family response regulator
MRKRVVVVDDDDISRRGLSEILADQAGIEIAAALDHHKAATWSGEWDGIDVAVVDAADERRRGDQFPGVAVVEAIRRYRSPDETMVVVITGHFFDDAVRRRMREAQADYFYHRSELADAGSLVSAVLQPDGGHHHVPDETDHEALHRLGITNATRVNQAVRYAGEVGGATGLLRGRTSRRAADRLRAAFNTAARLQPVNQDGAPPERAQDHPSLPQIQRFLDWATKAKR